MKSCVILSFIVCLAAGATVVFKNLCGYKIDVIRTQALQSPTVEVTLNSERPRIVAYNGGEMNFRPGWERMTTIEFWFNKRGKDYYVINVSTGFDTPVEVVPLHGYKVECHYTNCEDGILFPHEFQKRIRAQKAGQIFNVTFCPPYDP